MKQRTRGRNNLNGKNKPKEKATPQGKHSDKKKQEECLNSGVLFKMFRDRNVTSVGPRIIELYPAASQLLVENLIDRLAKAYSEYVASVRTQPRKRRRKRATPKVIGVWLVDVQENPKHPVHAVLNLLLKEMAKSTRMARTKWSTTDLGSHKKQNQRFRTHFVFSTLMPRGQKMVLLDLACGAGQISFTIRNKLKDRYVDYEYIGVDLEETFQKHASRLKKLYDDNHSFICLDIDSDMQKDKPELFDIIQQKGVTHLSSFNGIQYMHPERLERLVNFCKEHEVYISLVIPNHDNSLRLLDTYSLEDGIIQAEYNEEIYHEYYYSRAVLKHLKEKVFTVVMKGKQFYTTVTTEEVYKLSELNCKMVLILNPVVDQDYSLIFAGKVDEQISLDSICPSVTVQSLPTILKLKRDVFVKKNGILVKLLGNYAVTRNKTVFRISPATKIYGYGEFYPSTGRLHLLKVTENSGRRLVTPLENVMFKYREIDFDLSQIARHERRVEEGIVIETAVTIQKYNQFHLKPHPVLEVAVQEGFVDLNGVQYQVVGDFQDGVYEAVVSDLKIYPVRVRQKSPDNSEKVGNILQLYDKCNIEETYSKLGFYYPTLEEYVQNLRDNAPREEKFKMTTQAIPLSVLLK
jgi:hypothetical protein